MANLNEYVVLRVDSGKEKAFRIKQNNKDGIDLSDIKIECYDLSSKDLNDLRREGKTLALSRNVALSLHSKKSKSQSSRGKKNAWTWGVDYASLANHSKYDGSGVKVALIDSGIKKDHPAFIGKGIKVDGYDFVNNSPDYNDELGHGTNSAGILFGRDFKTKGSPKKFRIGVARGVTDILIAKITKSSGGYDLCTALKALKWAVEEGAEIVSMSFGNSFSSFADYFDKDREGFEHSISRSFWEYNLLTNTYDSFFRICQNRGNVLFIASAGNDSRREEKKNLVCYSSLPAIAENVFSVGALQSNAFTGQYKLEGTSNSGVDFIAPARNSYTAGINQDLDIASGTSISTPFVAGIASLWVQKYKQSSNGKYSLKLLKKSLINSCKREPSFNKYPVEDIGYGIPLPPK